MVTDDCRTCLSIYQLPILDGNAGPSGGCQCLPDMPVHFLIANTCMTCQSICWSSGRPVHLMVTNDCRTCLSINQLPILDGNACPAAGCQCLPDMPVHFAGCQCLPDMPVHFLIANTCRTCLSICWPPDKPVHWMVASPC